MLSGKPSAPQNAQGQLLARNTAKAPTLPAQAIRIAAAKSPLFNSSLAKGLAILAAFDSQNPTHSLPGLAAATGLTTSAAQRLSYTLESLGYLRRDPVSKQLALTPAVVELGLRYVQTDRLLKLSHAYLLDLNIKAGETVNLSVPSACDMVFVVSLLGHKQISVELPIGGRYPKYCTAAGRAYLSGVSPQAASAEIDRSELTRFTPQTITSAKRIKEMIEAARQTGYAWAEGEFYRGDINIASPVFNTRGDAIAAIGISVPASRWSLEEACREIAPLVIETARAISRA
jgi:DNA-binding IclR family transcriptional regulator